LRTRGTPPSPSPPTRPRRPRTAPRCPSVLVSVLHGGSPRGLGCRVPRGERSADGARVDHEVAGIRARVDAGRDEVGRVANAPSPHEHGGSRCASSRVHQDTRKLGPDVAHDLRWFGTERACRSRPPSRCGSRVGATTTTSCVGRERDRKGLRPAHRRRRRGDEDPHPLTVVAVGARLLYRSRRPGMFARYEPDTGS